MGLVGDDGKLEQARLSPQGWSTTAWWELPVFQENQKTWWLFM
jgi:hypothetical protein